MRYLLLLLLLASCTSLPEYEGSLELIDCSKDSCRTPFLEIAPTASCAFYDLDDEDLSLLIGDALVDSDNPHSLFEEYYGRGLMHHKFCVNKTHLVTGTYNPTMNSNQNIVLVLNNPYLAKEYLREQNLLHKSKTKNMEFIHNNYPLSLRFCPRDDCEETVLDELSKAKSSIKFLQFSFTSDAIGTKLVELHNEGVLIQGVFDPRINPRYSEAKTLENNNIPYYVYKGKGKLHTKLFIIDNSTLITGSYNPTKNGNLNNNENLLVIREPSVVAASLNHFSSVFLLSIQKQ